MLLEGLLLLLVALAGAALLDGATRLVVHPAAPVAHPAAPVAHPIERPNLTQPQLAQPGSSPRLVLLTGHWLPERDGYPSGPLLDLRHQTATLWAFPVDVAPAGDLNVIPAWHLEVQEGDGSGGTVWRRFEPPNLLYGVTITHRGSLPWELYDLLTRYPLFLLLGVRPPPGEELRTVWTWTEGRTPNPQGWVLRGGSRIGRITQATLRLVAPGGEITPPVSLWVLR